MCLILLEGEGREEEAEAGEPLKFPEEHYLLQGRMLRGPQYAMWLLQGFMHCSDVRVKGRVGGSMVSFDYLSSDHLIWDVPLDDSSKRVQSRGAGASHVALGADSRWFT